MANWHQLLNRIQTEWISYDSLRREYLLELYNLTWRNVVAYYSWWLQKNSPELWWLLSINDNDKNWFMSSLHELDCSKWLDLILHTPGWDLAATESIIDYLLSKFENIRVVVPQLAMSCGTIIACSANQIVMWKHSSLWPIDPQFWNMSAWWVMEEFQRAWSEMKQDPSKQSVWNPIISKYGPTFVWECEKSINWSAEIVKKNLNLRMLPWEEEKINRIVEFLANHSESKSHSRHFSQQSCKDLGLNIIDLESDALLQDAVLSVHHAFMHTFAATPSVKIIENHKWVAFVSSIQTVILQK